MAIIPHKWLKRLKQNGERMQETYKIPKKQKYLIANNTLGTSTK